MDLLSIEGFRVDLIITDMVMPEMNGTELTWKIRQLKNYQDVPVIMLSGNTKMENILNYFKSGISDYLCKPFISEELIARVRVHLSLYLQSKEAQQIMTELENVSRMKDELIAVCSHDIRTPLNAIVGNSELLLTEEIPGTKEYATDIKDNAMALLDLVTNLLDSGKKKSLEGDQKVELDLQNLIMKVVRQQKARLINKGLEIETNLNETFVIGDEISLIRVFSNLLSNAIKFTPSKGKITISCEVSGNHNKVIFQDSGIGIPKDMVPCLFDKYTKASRKGTDGEDSTGLGMSIVKELILNHDGTIDVESKEGKGTAFTIIFPQTHKSINKKSSFKSNKIRKVHEEAKTEEKTLISKANNPKPLKSVNEVNVLIAEDNNANLRLLEKMLRKSGFENIVKAQDGAEAMDSFEKLNPEMNFDMIITDIEMPEKNGDEFAAEVREMTKDIKTPFIISLSGHRGAKYPEGLFDANLTKPVILYQLKKALSNVCDVK